MKRPRTSSARKVGRAVPARRPGKNAESSLKSFPFRVFRVFRVFRGFSFFSFLLSAFSLLAQPSLTTILSNGPGSNRFNIVFVSEGYTSAQLPQFRTDAT